MVTHSLDVLGRIAPAVPARVAQLAEGWREGTEPASPLPSASVVLLRDGPGGLETYLLHRHARMSFAASMVVFPGGRVDPVDSRAAEGSVLACAVRETEEETGVRLDPAQVRAWAHWITPVVEPRRYDTYFFVAALPAGQSAADVSGETDRAEWSTPRSALAAAEAGEIALMPPTLSILTELTEWADVPAVLAAADGRVIEPVLPVAEPTSDGWRFRYPQARR